MNKCWDENKILCVSGGIDSFIAWHFLNKPKTVFFYTGSRYADKELEVVSNLIPDTIIDKSLYLASRERGTKAYIHMRNVLFAIQATEYAPVVVMAGLRDDCVSDKSPKAFQKVTEMMVECGGNHSHALCSPFWNLTKEQIVRWYIENPLTKNNDLLMTTSCYDPVKMYCGSCPSCFRKYIALRVNGFNINFYNRELLQYYLRRARNSVYIEERCNAIIKTAKKDKWDV